MSGNLDYCEPDSGPMAGGFNVDVYGSQFIATGPSRVQFRVGAMVPPTTFLSLTHVRLVMPSWPTPGTVSITCELVGPGAAEQNIGQLDFIYLPPYSLPQRHEPTRIPVGEETQVQLYGLNMGIVTAVREVWPQPGQPGTTYIPRPFTIVNDRQITYTSYAYPNTIPRSYLSVLSPGFNVGHWGPEIYEPAIPAGRIGTWRIMVAQRGFTNYNPSMLIAEVVDARSRRLERKLNNPARFMFTVDGSSASARLIRELEHEVLVTRWNELEGRDEEMFRGIITQSQDILSEQRHSINFTAQDNLAVARRRPMAQSRTFANTDQDTIAQQLMATWLNSFISSSLVGFAPAATIPLTTQRCYPDGTINRPLSGRQRDRTYPAQTNLYDAIDNLANVINGFDYDMRPVLGRQFQDADNFRVFYPYQGVQRQDFSFVYGSTVSALSRSVNSQAYGNYARVIGQTEEGQPQLYAEAWTDDANDIATNPAGFWAMGESMSDVTEVATLRNRALAMLAENSILVPVYSLSLRPGVFVSGAFDIGDTVQLRIDSGRLNVDTWVRVYGVTYVIGEDGEEDIEIDVGRASLTFLEVMRTTNKRIGALERR